MSRSFLHRLASLVASSWWVRALYKWHFPVGRRPSHVARDCVEHHGPEEQPKKAGTSLCKGSAGTAKGAVTDMLNCAY